MRWRIELLGGLRVRCGARLLAPFGNRKAAALLGYLAAFPGPHGRESLAETLWPDSDPRAARNRLRVALAALRQNLDDDILLADRTNLALNGALCDVDVSEFRAALERARNCPIDRRFEHWCAAFELYRGPLLPGFFESWIPAAEAELEANYVQCVRALMAALRHNGQAQRALEYGRHALSLTPLREELCGDLMELHVQLGQPANAVRLYRELKMQLRAQLQSAPSPALHALHEQLQNGAPISAPPEIFDAPASAGLADAATSKAFSLRPAPALPPSGTRFFGREADIETLSHSLSGGQARLVTLTGRGGIGKTRLAQETARALQNLWPGAVWFVPLHEVGEAELIVAQIQAMMGLPISESESAKGPSALETVGLALEAGPALLVLDNFEQLLPWGTPVVQWLLENAPSVRLLVTSRAPLKVAGETVFTLSALTFPTTPVSLDELMEFESMQLWSDRARVAAPHFRVTKHNAGAVAALCAQLEGWPLALELAGAQAATLRPQQMLARLQKRLEFLQNSAPGADYSHASLRAALEWSYELLAPAARQFFARLSVFRGSFDLEAARQIGDTPDAAHLLEQLCAASLVVAQDERFRLLETLREFALEQLAESELEALQQRHAHYFLRLAQAHQDAYTDTEDEPRMKSLARSRFNADNLRAALNWSLVREPETALALMVAMSSHGGDAFADAGFLAERALQNVPDAPPKLVSAVLGIAAQHAEYRGDHRRHRELAQRRLELVRTLGEPCEIAWAYFHLGCAAAVPGDYAGADAHLKQSLRLFQSLQDGSAIERQNLAWTLDRLGTYAQARGEWQVAQSYYRRALAAFVANGDRDGQASELCQWANVLTQQGQFDRARELFERAEQLERELGDMRSHPWRRFQRGCWHGKQGETAAAREHFARALRGFDAKGEIVGLLNSLLALSCLLIKENNYIEGSILLSCETEQRNTRELPLFAELGIEHHEAETIARAALGDSDFEAACARGRRLKLPAAVALALQTADKKETP